MNKFRTTLIITTLFSILGIVSTANAGVQHLDLPVCSLAVYPYNPAQPEIHYGAATPFVNFLSESICKARTTYGQQYNQPPTKAQNPVKNVADIENKNVPYAIHEHSYINNALEDNYYYRSYIDKFEIKLENDALNNTEKQQIQCQTPAPASFTGSAADLSDCNGSVNDINFYGGVKVSYSATSGVVTWEFGTVQKNLRPNMWGNNDSNPADSDNFNESLQSAFGAAANLADYNSVYRKFTPAVQLKTKNNSTDIWSATTTSRVLLRNYAILKSSFNTLPSGIAKFSTLCTSLGDYTKWCPVNTPSGQGYSVEHLGSSGQQEWFWFPIGSVVSVWSKTTTPPIDVACADLQWDGAFQKPNKIGLLSPDNINPNALLPDQAALMKFKTIYQSGAGTKRPLEYDWVSFNGDQNRPAWFKNDDALFVIQPIVKPVLELAPIVSLPLNVLQVAHAALPPVDTSSLTEGASVNPNLLGLLSLGKFKDEVNSTLLFNPLIDDDYRAYYTGGSAGVTLGVQAYYTDGKNLPGQGAMVNTPNGVKQKAEKCHLELKILPAPAFCIKLDLDPSTLKPNTPVTFTVTPHFDPADQTIPLNYFWNADQASGFSKFGKGLPNASVFDPSIFTKIPGGSSGGKPSWTINGLNDALSIGTSINGLIDPCANGGCETKPANPLLNPGGPFEQININAKGISTPALSGGLNLDLGASLGGANLFAADKIAALPSGLSAETSKIGTSSSVLDSLIQSNSGGGTDQIDLDGATVQEAIYGGFKDVQGGSELPTNPYLETKDNKTYYTGGPAGTMITVQAQGKDGALYPLCKNSLIIPAEAKCQQLKVKFLDGSTEVPISNLVAGTTYTIVVDQPNSKLTDGSPITQYNIRLNNADGPGAYGTLTAGPGNAGSCSAVTGAAGTIGTDSTSVNCQYLYTPKAKDQLKLEADPTDGVAACTIEQTIPEIPTTPICKSLNLVTNPLLGGTTISASQTIGLTTDPRDTDGLVRDPIIYSETGGGNFVAEPANAASCPAVPADSLATVTFEANHTCKYSYLAPSAPTGTETVSVKVKQDDGVPACQQNFTIIKPPKTTEICLSLNFKVNGSYTLNPLISAGQSYALQGDPITDKGNPVQLIEWTENGSGKLIGNPTNPGICPAIIDNGSVVTPAFCRYIYSSPSDADSSSGFSVRAVPDDGVPACKAASQLFTPPNVTPYCLYLDLDTSGTFNPLGSNNMNATVVMSDGSKYNDNVRFSSTDGSGNTTGGFGFTSGSGTGNFRTQTDATNNTHNVNFSAGSETTGLNIFLSDTTVVQTAACQRQLSPTVKPPKVCTIPPRINRTGNSFTAEGGDSSSYCWSISGPDNPLFTNGKNTATGDSVALDKGYSDFDLEVHDCNPKFSYNCSDRYTIEGTPHIEKKISKANLNSYTTKINYSTKGGTNVTEAVKYQLTYTPSDYAGGNLTASIYDPAFTGTIYGSKTKIDADTGITSQVPGGHVTVDLDSISVSSDSQTYNKCSGDFTPLDPCFEVPPDPPYSGFGTLTIHGIKSSDTITINYNGTLHSSINTKECQDGTACNEKVLNQSFVSNMKYCTEKTDSSGNTVYPCTTVSKAPVCQDVQYIDNTGKIVVLKPCTSGRPYMIFSNLTSIEEVCQYFLTRASGDIFLEDQLKYGLDISKCYPFKNISSTVTVPTSTITDQLAETGGGTPGEVISINHEICSAGQNNFQNTSLKPDQIEALSELYGSEVSNLSSQICEVGLVPGLVWTKDQINATIAQNIGKLTRWDNGVNPGKIIANIEDITSQGNSVYYYKGTGNDDKVTIDRLDIPEGSGSMTIIIDHADLQIDGNIEYISGETTTTADKISSLGVIVIDGNMYVDKNVDKLAGAYFIQRTNSTNYNVGNILAVDNKDSDRTLTVNGSIYGNIGPLFEHRTAAGDVGAEGGSITIRYDQRIIQNPPAGLSELIGDFSQSQIAQ